MNYYDKLSLMNIFLVSFYIYGYIKNYIVLIIKYYIQ